MRLKVPATSLLLAFVAGLSVAPAARAQSILGSVSGTVTDDSEFMVPNVSHNDIMDHRDPAAEADRAIAALADYLKAPACCTRL